MTPDFGIRFLIDREADDLRIILTDTSDYTGVSSYYGFFRIEYPDGVVVENTDQGSPDIDNSTSVFSTPLRIRKGLITGDYVFTLKLFTDQGDETLSKTASFVFSEPSLIMSDNSAIAVPSVSFIDTTTYSKEGYNHGVTRFITCDMPETSGMDTTVTTSSNEIFMAVSGNFYEGIYEPELRSDVLYTAANHEVRWIGKKSFVFDVRRFIGLDEIVQILNQVKERLNQSQGNSSDLRREYVMAVSLYSHITAKLGIGEFDVASLVNELQRLAYNLSCKCCPKDYVYSDSPLPPFDPENLIRGFPFIDQVIYREWNENIVFRDTSTIFHRVDGKIKWFKSKVNDNVGNPIFINGELNSDFWEPVNDCCELVTFRQEYVYMGGPMEFQLPYPVKTVILVSANGYGPFFSSDYTLNENRDILRILPPNELIIGTEVVIIATYDGNDIIEPPNILESIRQVTFVWNDDDPYIFQLPETAAGVFQLHINGVWIRPIYFIHGGSQVQILSDITLEDGDVVSIYYYIMGVEIPEGGIFVEQFDEPFV